MKTLLAIIAALGLTAARAEARVDVVTTIETFKVITEEIGGGNVSVTALVGANVDPHFVDPRPSYALTLNRAELLIHVGLDLEAGWLPPLLEQSRNPKIQTGQPGNLDASTAGITVLEGTGTSRSQGDIHPLGNPHYWLPPANALAVARAITARLKQIDPARSADYDQGLARFVARAEARAKEWARLAEGLRGVKVVSYHKSWSYLTGWLGLVEIGYVEPKPGIPPSPSHLAQLVQTAKTAGAKMVIVESYYPQNTARRVAELAGMKLVTLPSDAGGALRSYVDLVDHALARLANAAR
jgi:zinc/manganese transport system substrate-binding protein